MVELLGSLVDKSLVQTDSAHGDLRYRLLETIRQYSAEKLSQSSQAEEDAVGTHARYFLDLAEKAGPHLSGGNQAVWFDLLELEHDNVRTAFAFLVSERGSHEEALRLAFALRDFWFGSYLREGTDLLDAALDRVPAEPSRLGAACGVIAGYLQLAPIIHGTA